MGAVKRFEVKATPSDRGLLGVIEAAAYLGIAVGTLRHWASAGKIEYVRAGKFLKFRKAALDRWIERQTVTAVTD